MTTSGNSGPEKFNFNYRPESYLDATSPITEIIANIKGTKRKALVKTLLAADNIESLEDWMVAGALGEADRVFLGSIHPLLMGGEYLPDLDSGEMEIASITLQSVTGDVISIRARQVGAKIYYRIANEYEDAGVQYTCEPEQSALPLTMHELIGLMDSAEMVEEEGFKGLTNSFRNFNMDGGDYESLRHFVTVSSDFYPELERYYDEEAQRWYEEQKALRFEDDIESGNSEE